eukprot:3549277-Prorocentrum_lima.AAC.1
MGCKQCVLRGLSYESGGRLAAVVPGVGRSFPSPFDDAIAHGSLPGWSTDGDIRHVARSRTRVSCLTVPVCSGNARTCAAVDGDS